MTGIRRVVTGYGPDGRAEVVSDELVESALVPDPNPFAYGTVKGASALHATASADCLMQLADESVGVVIGARHDGVPLRTP